MTHSTARAGRNFARPVVRRRAQTTRLRLDSLENREQPGSVLSGLTVGGMLEPLAAMSSVVGPNALTLAPVRTLGASGPATPSNLVLPRLPLLSSSWLAVRPRPASDGGASPPRVESSRPSLTGLEIDDLLMPTELSPAKPLADAGGGLSGTGSGHVAPSAAGTSTTNTPPAVHPTQPAETGLSLASAATASAPVAPTSGTPAGTAATPAVRNVVTVHPIRPHWPEAGGVGGFLIARPGTTGDLTVHYRVAGTAKPGADYTPLSGSVTITHGNRAAAVVLDPLKFDAATGRKTVSLRVTGGEGYKVGATNAVAVRLGRFTEQPVVSVQAILPTASSAGETRPGAITFTRTNAVGNLKVEYGVQGTAAPGGNYLALPGSVVIPAGQTSVIVPIRPVAG